MIYKTILLLCLCLVTCTSPAGLKIPLDEANPRSTVVPRGEQAMPTIPQEHLKSIRVVTLAGKEIANIQTDKWTRITLEYPVRLYGWEHLVTQDGRLPLSETRFDLSDDLAHTDGIATLKLVSNHPREWILSREASWSMCHGFPSFIRLLVEKLPEPISPDMVQKLRIFMQGVISESGIQPERFRHRIPTLIAQADRLLDMFSPRKHPTDADIQKWLNDLAKEEPLFLRQLVDSNNWNKYHPAHQHRNPYRPPYNNDSLEELLKDLLDSMVSHYIYYAIGCGITKKDIIDLKTRFPERSMYL